MRMEYSKLRNKVGKFYNGGQIRKYAFGDTMSFGQNIDTAALRMKYPQLANKNDEEIESMMLGNIDDGEDARNDEITNQMSIPKMSTDDLISNVEKNGISSGQDMTGTVSDLSAKAEEQVKQMGDPKSDTFKNRMTGATGGIGGSGISGGMIAQAGVGAMKAIDNLAMGDKNFGAQSQAIDSAVHGVSGALMSSGNPYAMAAGAALEGMNFLTKAGGETVQGYDVNIENSGFGTLGHMESSSSRDFGAMIGLGGLFRGNMEKKLAKRNEQARMALKAAEISEDVKFEQEARMNSVDNVLRNNQIALAGGIDTSLLGS